MPLGPVAVGSHLWIRTAVYQNYFLKIPESFQKQKLKLQCSKYYTEYMRTNDVRHWIRYPEQSREENGRSLDANMAQILCKDREHPWVWCLQGSWNQSAIDTEGGLFSQLDVLPLWCTNLHISVLKHRL
jgi:hypothetical protein